LPEEVFLKPIVDINIINLIERIGEHYRANIANPFLRPALLQLSLDKTTLDQIEILMEKIHQFKYQGLHLDELYRQISASALFVSAARRDLGPSIRNRLTGSAAGADKVLRDMAINTFPSNVQVLGKMLNELFEKLVELDEADARGRKPLYQQMPELADISIKLLGA
jgi:hypothetical protein